MGLWSANPNPYPNPNPNPKPTPTPNQVLQGEHEDKALRIAEMEANKAANVLEHSEEIYSRPARSWFQTSQEKEAAAKRSKQEAPTAKHTEAPVVELPKPKVKRDKYAGLTRQQRRKRQRDEL